MFIFFGKMNTSSHFFAKNGERTVCFSYVGQGVRFEKETQYPEIPKICRKNHYFCCYKTKTCRRVSKKI